MAGARRRGTIQLWGLCVLGLLAAAICAQPANAKPAATDVTIDYTFLQKPGMEEIEFEDFSGEVTSDRGRCLDGRKVTLFRKRSGDDVKVATVNAMGGDDSASWIYLPENQEPGPDTRPGKYYAQVKTMPGCKEGTSPIERVSPGG